MLLTHTCLAKAHYFFLQWENSWARPLSDNTTSPFDPLKPVIGQGYVKLPTLAELVNRSCRWFRYASRACGKELLRSLDSSFSRCWRQGLQHYLIWFAYRSFLLIVAVFSRCLYIVYIYIFYCDEDVLEKWPKKRLIQKQIKVYLMSTPD